MAQEFKYTGGGEVRTGDYDTLADIIDLGIEMSKGSWLDEVSIGDMDDSDIAYDTIGHEVVCGAKLFYGCLDGTSGVLSLSDILSAVRDCMVEWEDSGIPTLEDVGDDEASEILYYAIYQRMM